MENVSGCSEQKVNLSIPPCNGTTKVKKIVIVPAGMNIEEVRAQFGKADIEVVSAIDVQVVTSHLINPPAVNLVDVIKMKSQKTVDQSLELLQHSTYGKKQKKKADRGPRGSSYFNTKKRPPAEPSGE